jgi:hypothetical protein
LQQGAHPCLAAAELRGVVMDAATGLPKWIVMEGRKHHPHVERVYKSLRVGDRLWRGGVVAPFWGGVAASFLLSSVVVELPLAAADRIHALIRGQPYPGRPNGLTVGAPLARFFGRWAWQGVSAAVTGVSDSYYADYDEVCKSCGRHTGTPGCTYVRASVTQM